MHYRNLTELHRRQAERLGPLPALRFKRHGLYHDLTWQQYRADALACAAALVEAGVRPGDRVGLLAENRVEWLVADMGILAAAAVNVPPHAPLTARQVQFQFADAGVTWLFVSTRQQLEKVLQVAADLPELRGIVAFEGEKGDAALFSARGEKGDAALFSARKELRPLFWAGFLQRGRELLPRLDGELRRREAALTEGDLATIMYTSGTTGNPKGVMLSHGNLLSNAVASMAASPLAADAVLLSWLPYSHIYARLVDHYKSVLAGTLICLAESADTVVQNLEDVEPTHLTAVPRFYEKVLTASAAVTPEKTASNLRKVFGRRMQLLCSGGAPLPLPVAEAYHAAGLLLLQGYGLTESSPVISFNSPERFKMDTVGPPLPGVEVRIAADGEVLVRGPLVMLGYWNNPAATAEAIRDGWLYTGDLGELDADGYLKITGRKKELMVLSSGKKLVPPYLEGLLLADPCIDQAVVCGEGRNFLTALIVPHWENVRQALQAEGGRPGGLQCLSEDDEQCVRDLLRRRMDAALADVSSWERVKKFAILREPLSVANEELTVSLKLRRQVVLQKYADLIAAMYRE
jgi:long-chain acyl-CoA synthetase